MGQGRGEEKKKRLIYLGVLRLCESIVFGILLYRGKSAKLAKTDALLFGALCGFAEDKILVLEPRRREAES